MALPEHVKRQAMDAVAHKETTALIRHYSNDNSPAEIFSIQQPRAQAVAPARGSISEDVKKQAMDAVSHPDTQAQIRLVSARDIESPLATPTRDSIKASEKIAQMHQSGQSIDAVHQAATKDGFGREHGG